MIDPSIWINESFGGLTPSQRLLQIGLISLADDQGRGKAHPAYLRAQLFPYDDLQLQEIADGLQLIQKNGTIKLYEVGSKSYYQLLRWWDFQSLSFAQPSQWPRPDGWADRVRINAGKTRIVTCNWITSSGSRLPDTCDQDGVIHVDGHMDGHVDGHMDGHVELQIRSDQNHDHDPDHDQTHDHDQPESPAGDEMDGLGTGTGMDGDKDDLTAEKADRAIRMAWLKEIGSPLSQRELNRLKTLAKTHGHDSLIRAIVRAGEFGGKFIKYVTKILESPDWTDTSGGTFETTMEELRRRYIPSEFEGIINRGFTQSANGGGV